MKIRYAAIMFLVAFLLQTSILNFISIFGITPNLILCLVAIITFLYVDSKAYAFGIVFGLLWDMCNGPFLGVSALAYLMVSLAVLVLRETINKENKISAIIVSIVATLVYNLTYFVLCAGLGSEYSILYWLKLQPGYIIYNTIVIFIMYSILIKKVVRFRNDRFLVKRR